MTHASGFTTITFVLVLNCASPPTAQAVFGPVSLISRGFDGSQPDGDCLTPVVSADGSVIAFTAAADNLVSDDTNGVTDVFIVDQRAGSTTRVVGLNGEFPSDSSAPEISDDGRLVAFIEEGTLHVVDRATGGLQDVITLNNLPYGFSGNGRFLAITADDSQQLSPTDQNGVSDIYLYDRLAGTYERISRTAGSDEPNDKSVFPAVTPDGRYVAFVSSAGNLVVNDNGRDGVFVRDRIANTIERVSGFGADEADLVTDPVPPSLSTDGRFVAYFATDSSDTVQIYLRDRTMQTTARLGVGPSTMPDLSTNSLLSLSRDGLHVVYGAFGDTSEDVFVFDRNTSTTNIVSRGQDVSDGDSTGARLSAGGRAIVFASDASNLVPSGADGSLNNIYVANAGPQCAGLGDINCDGAVNAADIAALIELIFGGGS